MNHEWCSKSNEVTAETERRVVTLVHYKLNTEN